MTAGDEHDEMEWFLRALDLSGEARAAWVAGIRDPALRARVTALVAAHGELGDREPIVGVPSGPSDLAMVVAPGTMVDGFRIVELVGRGGMGVVYAAEQLEPRRRVALKTLPPDWFDVDAVRRLEKEARLLARLVHPGIAHVYGSGRAAAFGGAPYLVLEYVDGQPLDRFVATRRVDEWSRLRLVADVAEAVAHAHSRGVVHRDLKPGNVLVDTEGRAKVLDFGIARLVQGTGEPDPGTLRTRPGQVLGTLPYMAPESFGDDGVGVDPRVDVYALGVIAYQLLAGRLPVDVAGRTLAAAVRTILDSEPPRLGQIDRRWRGEVELVVGKAMAKDPGVRYPSAAEFAADLRRLLAGEPVLAHPPSRTYRLRKLARRHRVLVMALGMVLTTLVVALWQVEQARRAAVVAGTEAHAAAVREQQRAQAAFRLGDVLAGIVRRVTPQHHGGEPEPITAIVDELAAEVSARAAGDPWVEARVHLFLADARHRTGLAVDARRHFDAATAAFARSELTVARDRVQLAVTAARLLMVEGHASAAEAELRRALEVAVDDPDGADDLLIVQHELANTLAALDARLDEAAAMAEQVVLLARRRHGERSAWFASALHALALVDARRGRLAEAIAGHERVVVLRQELQPASLALATAEQNLAHALQLAERVPEALAACERAIAIQRRAHGGRRHRDLGYSLDVAGTLLRQLGRAEQALPCFEEAAQHFRAQLGDDHPDLAVCLAEWGTTLAALGREPAAIPLLEQAAAIHQRHAPDGSAARAAALEALATAKIGRAPIAEARELAEAALAMRRRVHGAEHPLVGRGLEALGTVLLNAGDWAACEATGRELLALRRRECGDAHWLPWTHASLVWIPLARRGAHEEALDLASQAAAALERAGAGPAWLRHALEAKRDLEQLTGRTAAAAATAERLASLAQRR